MKKLLILPLLALSSSLFTLCDAQLGTWTAVTNKAPNNCNGVMVLMTDGTVLCKDDAGPNEGTGWNKLTPDATGSYANGTWTSIASMHTDRLFFSSQVLPSGELYVAGGEYSGGNSFPTNVAGEVYNPVTNTWTVTGPVPSGWSMADANSEILPDGNVLEGIQEGADPSFDILQWSPTTLNYTTEANAPCNHDEAAWLKLPDNSILYIGINSTSSCRYIPATNSWVADATVPVNIYDPYGEEAGAAFMLPNGKAVFFGAFGSNVMYTPSGNTTPGTWTQIDSFPIINGARMGQTDAAGCMMINGHILLAVSPINTSASNQFLSPFYFLEYDYTTNTFTQNTSILPTLTADNINAPCNFSNMLQLPNGQVLFGESEEGVNQYWVYTPGSGQIPQGIPTINSILPDGCPNYKLTGKLFNGISEGAGFGDDWQNSTNYPIIRLTSASGKVYYAKTTYWNRIGAVQTDSLEDTTVFTMPTLPAGTYSLVVTANGFASNPILWTTLGVTIASHTNATCSTLGTATANAATGGMPSYTYSWSPIGGTNITASNLSIGTYTVTVTDNNGCTATASVVITQPRLTITIASSTGANCNSSGSATANAATGGTSPYTYDWSPSGGTNLTASNLSAGIYTITATDVNGCQGTVSVSITQPTLSITIASQTNASCSGTGSATANAATGGTSPYTYSWSPSGGSNLTASNLTIGTYTITATDAHGCTGSTSVTIQPASSYTTIFSQNFEGTATIYKNNVVLTGGTPPTVPVSQTWGSANANDGNNTLHRDDVQGTWASNDDICGQAYQPIPTCAANGSTYSAIFDNWDANTHSTGNIISPTINLATASCGTLFTFFEFNGDCRTSGDQATIALQFNNGSGYTTVWSDLVGCTTSWVADSVVIPSAYLVANFKFQFLVTAGLNAGDLYPVGVDEIVIQTPSPLSITPSVTAVECEGGNTGTASASICGGVAPYTYSWSNAQTTANISGLSAGTYTLTVIDEPGCSSTASVAITQPTAVAITIASHTNGGCSTLGSATANAATGGTSPYNYSWSPSGGTNLSATNLNPGTYTITATDNHGCTATASVAITTTSFRDSIANITYPLCNGGTGSATVGVKNGTSPYTYSWSPNTNSTASASSLSAGTYTVTITDHAGCTAPLIFSITQPALLTASVNIIADVNCNGGSNGNLSSTIGGGTMPYTYTWTGGSTNTTLSGLSIGTYTLNITDNNGCTASASASITQPAQLNVTDNTTSNLPCYGENSGSATSSPSGGTSPYAYSWTGGGTNSSYTGLTAGTYTTTVTDNNGCIATASTVITQPTQLVITRDSTNVTINSGTGCNGAAGVIASGATPPYTYSWTPGGGKNDTINGKCAGTYCCTVTDKNGCTETVCITIKSTVGIENITGNSSLVNIYPDPNKGTFFVETAVPFNKATIEIDNVLGQQLLKQQLTGSKNEINLISQPSGVYIYRVLDETGKLEAIGKLVIQK